MARVRAGIGAQSTMSSSDREHRAGPDFRQLVKELEQLELEQQGLNLRDRLALDEWQSKIERLRRRIESLKES
jgi:hypothetical protein